MDSREIILHEESHFYVKTSIHIAFMNLFEGIFNINIKEILTLINSL